MEERDTEEREVEMFPGKKRMRRGIHILILEDDRYFFPTSLVEYHGMYGVRGQQEGQVLSFFQGSRNLCVIIPAV